jgi:hypothetical protein
VPISIPESLVVALPPILSPSSRIFVELSLVNWRRPWGSRRLDFVIWAGSFNFFIGKIIKFCGCPTAAARLFQQIASRRIIFIGTNYRLHHQDLQRFEFVQIDGSLEPRKSIYMLLQ